MSDIVISQAHNNYRLAGTLEFLNLGTGAAKIQIYGNTRPAFNGDPGVAPLVEITLTDPAGSVSGGFLVLEQAADAMNAQSGAATWARVVNGNGDTAFDCDVSDNAGAATIKLVDTMLRAGGVTRLISAVLG